MAAPDAAGNLRKRLLGDIAELQAKPYPNIRLHTNDSDVTKACLVLTPANTKPIHLSVTFPSDYPLRAPSVSINTRIMHPNVYGDYICASILNTREGYTPAYTLKGIAIQLLSFFSSESLEQDLGGKVDLIRYQVDVQQSLSGLGIGEGADTFQCQLCRFGMPPSRRAAKNTRSRGLSALPTAVAGITNPSKETCFIDSLPDEIFLLIFEKLDFEELTRFAQSWSRVGNLIARFDVVRVRELQCFVLKENFVKRKLGVGVSIDGRGRQGRLQSEFDLLSGEAFTQNHIRVSVQGLLFQRWLPLPLAHGHWRRVKNEAYQALSLIATDARISGNDNVIYAFMNDVIVRLNEDVEGGHARQLGRDECKSTLRHASEKAIESYFHLFHLLLCLAVDRPAIVTQANRMIADFLAGRTTKQHVPNLGYLLTALLISDHHPTEALMKKIVTEAITRNVVWLLDGKGAGFAELGYLESDPISQYRLKRTFEGSRTSYRLLMFSELFRRAARPSPVASALESATAPTDPVSPSSTLTAAAVVAAAAPPAAAPAVAAPRKKTIHQVRDELFTRHGGPPPGAATRMASEVRRLQKIDDFPSFLREMGITIPSASLFTTMLRETVKDSATKGYSRSVEPLARQLAVMRLQRDPTVDRERVVEALKEKSMVLPEGPEASRMMQQVLRGEIGFFPGGGIGPGVGGRGRGGSGRGR